MTNSKRNDFLDVLKGIAIILVVVGHCIQYGNGILFADTGAFFNNILFRFIYSFHMPLFVLISGYLFFTTLQKKDVKSIVKSKISTLVLPIFTWTLLQDLLLFLFGKTTSFDIISSINHSFSNWTFLWALFTIILLTICVEKVYNGKPIYYLILILLTNLFNKPELNFMYYLLPYFIIGYKFNQYKTYIKKYTDKIVKNKYICALIILVFSVVFALMLKKFDYPNYIYTSNYYIGEDVYNMLNNLFRFAIGLVGSALVCVYTFLLRKLLVKIKILISFGKNSIGIYIISCILNGLLLMDGITKDFSLNYFNIAVESLAMLSLSYTITILIQKNQLLSKIFFGKFYPYKIKTSTNLSKLDKN